MSRALRADPWASLRAFTAARIGLGRAGNALPTRELLAFGLAHAQARDAVHVALDTAALQRELDADGVTHVAVHSAAADRPHFLRRPDLGRQLDAPSCERLLALPAGQMPDAVLVIADGLSARAVHSHALPLLRALHPLLADWQLAPIVIAEQARVALGDEIGALVKAAQVVMLIGERPGLSSPDSLGIYLTHGPRVGLTDADRNCISNVRPEGLPPAAAAARLAWLMRAAHEMGRSGIGLKDDSAGRDALAP